MKIIYEDTRIEQMLSNFHAKNITQILEDFLKSNGAKEDVTLAVTKKKKKITFNYQLRKITVPVEDLSKVNVAKVIIDFCYYLTDYLVFEVAGPREKYFLIDDLQVKKLNNVFALYVIKKVLKLNKEFLEFYNSIEQNTNASQKEKETVFFYLRKVLRSPEELTRLIKKWAGIASGRLSNKDKENNEYKT